MGAGKLGAQALVWNPSTAHLDVTSKSSCLCKQLLCCCPESTFAPAWQAPTCFPAELCFLGQGCIPKDVTQSVPWETVGTAGQKVLWAALFCGQPLGQAGCSLQLWWRWRHTCKVPLGGQRLGWNRRVTCVPSTIALPGVPTMASLESLKFLLKQRIVTLWLLCSGASWWYSVIKRILWFWLSEGLNDEKLACLFVCFLLLLFGVFLSGWFFCWLPFGCFWATYLDWSS